MRRLQRALWREPRSHGPPRVGRADWLLVGGFEAATVVEGIARPNLAGRPFVTLLVMAVLPVLLWRRSHPLTACLVGFGVAGLLSAIQLVARTPDLGPSSMMAILILLYALVRWGSGKEIAAGLLWVAAVVALGMYAVSASLTDVVGGILFLLLFVALAAVFRSRADLWQRRQREVRNEERLALARELHDTVAHHVSAIAVQAQAGGVVARTQLAQRAQLAQPDQAGQVDQSAQSAQSDQSAQVVQALAAIEAEATRALAQMRTMVRVIREDSGDQYAPAPGVGDLTALARTDAVPVVEVSLTGAVTGLPGPVDAAVYRIAQEALTNALRHARGATQIAIEVCRVGDDIRLRVTDDGATHAGSAGEPGLGLTGMAERANLLGGRISAGPAPHGGWVVETLLPVQVPR